MASSKKGKNKKRKEKSIANKKQIEISNDLKFDLGYEKEGDRLDQSKYLDDDEVERLLYGRIEAAYKEASKILMDLGYEFETAKTALLSAGLIAGDRDIVSSIIKNSLTLINSSHQVNGKVIFDREPIFEDLHEMIKFWMQILINMVETKCPGLPRANTLQYILSSKSLSIERTTQATSTTPQNQAQASSSSSSNINVQFDFDTLLDENVAALKRLMLTYTPDLIRQLVATAPSKSSFAKIKEEFLECSVQSNDDHLKAHVEKAVENDDQNLDPLKCFLGCYDETSFKEWLKNSCDEQKEEMASHLQDFLGSLEKRVEERKEWAWKRAEDAIEKLHSDTLQLSQLRLEKKEKEKRTREKEELASSWTSKILKKELDSRKENRQLDRLTEQVNRLEAKNTQIIAEVAAFQLNESERKKNLKEAMKKEKENLKKIKNSEKQITKTQGETNLERQKILHLEEEFKNIEQAQEEAKLIFKKEMEEKEQARILVLEEKSQTRIARENASARLSSLQHEVDMENKRVMDDKLRLMEELSSLKIAYYCKPHSLASGSSMGGSSQKVCQEMQIPDHRRCTLCYRKEVCVLFVPCAHQVVCFDCAEIMGDHCPSCHGPIVKKYRVYGGNSWVMAVD